MNDVDLQDALDNVAGVDLQDALDNVAGEIQALIAAIHRDLRAAGVDTFERAARIADDIERWDDAEWRELCIAAGVQTKTLPSAETRAMVVARFRERVDMARADRAEEYDWIDDYGMGS